MPKTSPSALVTGASRGIGFAVCEALAARGYALAVCARGREELDRAAASLSRRTGVLARCVDVSNAAQVESFVTEAVEAFGCPEIVVNNAGIFRGGEVEAASEGDWDAVMDVNLKGTFLVTRAALPHLKKLGRGYFFNVASVAGKKGLAGVPAYGASKFGVVGFTLSLAEEIRPMGLRATAICPGYVATDMTRGAPVPPEEMISPSDIARTILYLLDLSPHVLVREVVMERTGA
jgi:3-oxoacyl-[acyl-carrier protein] reductase